MVWYGYLRFIFDLHRHQSISMHPNDFMGLTNWKHMDLLETRLKMRHIYIQLYHLISNYVHVSIHMDPHTVWEGTANPENHTPNPTS